MRAIVIHPSRGDRGGVMNASVAHAYGLTAAGVSAEFWTGSAGAAAAGAELSVPSFHHLSLAEPWAPLATSEVWRRGRRGGPVTAVVHQGARSWAWAWALWPRAVHAVVFHNARIRDRRLFLNWMTLSSRHKTRLAGEKAWLALTPRIAAVKNGDAQSAARAPAPRRAWRPDGRLVIGALGTLEARKGQDLLIEALALLRGQGIDAELRLGGEGGDREGLRRRAAALGVAEAVRFDGWVDAVSFLAGLDIFCLPSRSEPFGLVLLEAMSQGVPVVATDTDGPADILSGGAGLLAPPEDPAALAAALARLAADGDFAAALAAAGRDRARMAYGPKAVGESLLAAIEEFRGRTPLSTHDGD